MKHTDLHAAHTPRSYPRKRVSSFLSRDVRALLALYTLDTRSGPGMNGV
ncbi:MAG: hypothetical protein JKY25_07240 [Robiginitomaculum sp.]|nr:hypothetical protein [Robiginitomaculum sp.]